MSDTPDVERLAELARLELSEKEAAQFREELSSILAYVGQVQEASTDGPDTLAGDVENVFREDEISHAGGEHSERLLEEAPDTQDGYVKVNKIL